MCFGSKGRISKRLRSAGKKLVYDGKNGSANVKSCVDILIHGEWYDWPCVICSVFVAAKRGVADDVNMLWVLGNTMSKKPTFQLILLRLPLLLLLSCCRSFFLFVFWRTLLTFCLVCVVDRTMLFPCNTEDYVKRLWRWWCQRCFSFDSNTDTLKASDICNEQLLILFSF